MAANKRTEYQAKYDTVNSKRYTLKFNLKTDADLISKLESVNPIQAYIKNAIRHYMQYEQAEQQTGKE